MGQTFEFKTHVDKSAHREGDLALTMSFSGNSLVS